MKEDIFVIYFERLLITQETHIILDYRRKRIQNSTTKVLHEGPYPEGLSGCGVWIIPKLISDDLDSLSFFPTGIIIEFHKERSALIATRMRLVTEAIRQTINSNVPKTKLLKVNINPKKE